MTALVLAWGLSVVPLLAEAALGLRFEGAIRTGLVLLPWLALAGLPRRRSSDAPGSWLWVLVALPPVVLAAAIDRIEAPASAALLRVVGIGLTMVALGAWASRRAGSASRAYAGAWCAIVPGFAALLVALRFAALPGSAPAPAWLQLVERLHPLAWIWHASAVALDPLREAVEPWPLLTLVGLASLACLAPPERGGPVAARASAASKESEAP